MRDIGIEEHNGIVYEGSPHLGYRATPQPTILPIKFVSDPGNGKGEEEKIPRTIFREFSFDSVTRIRRGCVYNRFDFSQPKEWAVSDPLRIDLPKKSYPNYEIYQYCRAFTYQRDSLQYLRKSHDDKVSVLGKDEFQSFWRVVSIEADYNGTPLLILKSFRSLGELPHLISERIPDECRTHLLEFIEKLETSIVSQGANDVVDRCRDVLSIVFGTLAGDRTEDLFKSIEGYCRKHNAGKPNLVSYCGNVVARLHAKGKPNVQATHKVMGLQEEHAQLALRCVFVALTETGWAAANS